MKDGAQAPVERGLQRPSPEGRQLRGSCPRRTSSQGWPLAWSGNLDLGALPGTKLGKETHCGLGQTPAFSWEPGSWSVPGGGCPHDQTPISPWPRAYTSLPSSHTSHELLQRTAGGLRGPRGDLAPTGLFPLLTFLWGPRHITPPKGHSHSHQRSPSAGSHLDGSPGQVLSPPPTAQPLAPAGR